MPAQDPARQLAREISSLRREVSSLSRGSQMRYRSIDGGGIPVYDDDGSLRGTIGILPDGTTGFQTVNDPPPPMPSAPILEPVIGGLQVTWDGTFWGGDPTPGDLKRVEIHASPYSVYTATEATHRADFIAPGTVLIPLPPDAYTVVFVAVTTGGTRSEPSVAATETPEKAPTEADVTAARQAAADAAQAAADAQTVASSAQDKALEAAGLAAEKGRIYYDATAPEGDPNGLWIDTAAGNVAKVWDGTDWIPAQDQSIQDAAQAAADAHAAATTAQGQADTALQAAQSATSKADSALSKAETALTTANGKNKVFWRASTNPPPDPLIDGDLWFVTDLGNLPRKRVGTAWVDAKFEDGAVASLNVGKLVTGQLSAGQRIIAGLMTGTHAEMNDNGFKVFAADPSGGAPAEVVRMGTASDDFFGVVDRTGHLLASIDSTGDGNFKGLAADRLTVGGRDLGAITDEAGKGAVAYFEAYPPPNTAAGFGDYGNINDRVGILEANGMLEKGRRYSIRFKSTFFMNHLPGEVRYTIVYTGPSAEGSNTAATPVTTSPTVDQFLYSAVYDGGWANALGETTFTPTTSGRHRFLLCAERGGAPGQPANSALFVVSGLKTLLGVNDIGPAIPLAGTVSQGGASFYQGPPPPPPPPPTQSYYVDLGPSGRRSWGGNGAVIGNGTDVYQGYESYNGNTRGMFWFDLPNITGTVDRVDVYMYFRHWWFNSGGRVLMNASDQRATPEGGNFYKFFGDWEPNVTVPKPGSLTVTLPSDWWPRFRGTDNNNYNGRATCITIGPGPGTNQTYYGIATDCRLRIWYTQ